MDERHKANVEALRRTLETAAETGTNAIIRSKDAGEYAGSLQHALDERFDLDAQRNMAENTGE